MWRARGARWQNLEAAPPRTATKSRGWIVRQTKEMAEGPAGPSNRDTPTAKEPNLADSTAGYVILSTRVTVCRYWHVRP